MTAIVGLARAGRVYMGGDSAMTAKGGEQWLCATPKVWRSGSYVFGASGDADYIELCKRALARQPGPPEEVPELIAKLLTELDSEAEGSLIFGTTGVLYELQGASVVRYAGGLLCTGSGRAEARAALYKRPGAPLALVKLALSAAAATRSDVRRPFHVVTA